MSYQDVKGVINPSACKLAAVFIISLLLSLSTASRLSKNARYPGKPACFVWEHGLILCGTSRLYANLTCPAGAPFVRFSDRNVSYHSLVGMDKTPDYLDEFLRLRIFLVSSFKGHTINAPVIVRGSIMRESLDYQPNWDIDCNPRHYCVCLNYNWRIQLYLKARSDEAVFLMAFMDEIPGVPYYFEHCPRAQGGYEPMANISPYFMQVRTLPSVH